MLDTFNIVFPETSMQRAWDRPVMHVFLGFKTRRKTSRNPQTVLPSNLANPSPAYTPEGILPCLFACFLNYILHFIHCQIRILSLDELIVNHVTYSIRANVCCPPTGELACFPCLRNCLHCYNCVLFMLTCSMLKATVIARTYKECWYWYILGPCKD